MQSIPRNYTFLLIFLMMVCIFAVTSRITKMLSVSMKPDTSTDPSISAGPLFVPSSGLLDTCGSSRFRKSTHNSHSQFHFCPDKHGDFFHKCNMEGANIVKARGDILDRTAGTHNESRPFSLQPFNSHINQPLPQCKDTSEILQSIKLGTRHWDDDQDGNNVDSYNHSDPLQRERRHSRFVPSSCELPSFPPSPEQTCDILNQYSHVIITGDSLHRHLYQTITMIMRDEWVNGAMMTTGPNVNFCTCDGQYSEHRKCRKKFHEIVSPFDVSLHHADYGDVGLCENLAKATQVVEPFKLGTQLTEHVWEQIDCTDPDYRGLLLVKNGGLHHNSNSSTTFGMDIAPILLNPTYQKCLEMNKVTFIFADMTGQSRSMDQKYFHQSRENALNFNAKMHSLVHTSDLPGSDDIIFINW